MGKIVFFFLLGGMGHLNLAQAISKRIFQLYEDEHEIYFLLNKTFAEKVQKINPRIKCLIYAHPSLDTVKNEKDFVIEIFEKFGPSLRINDRVRFVNEIAGDQFQYYELNRAIYPEVTRLLDETKPDCEFFLKNFIVNLLR